MNLNFSLWVLTSPISKGSILWLASVSRGKELGNSGVITAPSRANSYSTRWNICSLEGLSKLNSVLKLPVHYHSGMLLLLIPLDNSVTQSQTFLSTRETTYICSKITNTCESRKQHSETGQFNTRTFPVFLNYHQKKNISYKYIL